MATRRTVRIPRPPARPVRVPPAPFRRRRGPQPPDAAVDALVVAHEADPDSHTGQWTMALLLASRAIQVNARRGVGQAGIDVPAAFPDAPEDLPGALASRVAAARSRGASAAAIAALIANWVHAVHSRAVMWYARAGGSETYAWTSRRDGLVRELHVELDGTIHRWDTPPVSGTNGFRGHPGEPAACRCTAWPLPATKKNGSAGAIFPSVTENSGQTE